MTNEQLLTEIGMMLDTKLDQKLDEKLDRKLDEKLEKIFDTKLQPVNNQLNNIYDRLDGIDDRLDGIDVRLDSMDTRLTKVELTQENKILPALNELSVLYSSAFKKFDAKADKIDKLEQDVEILKEVTAQHSAILKKIS